MPTGIAIFSTDLNSLNSYLTLIILFNTDHLFAHSEVVTSIAINTNYSIEHYSFICIQLNSSMKYW